MFLKEHKYIVKERNVPKYNTCDIEITFDSDRENSDEEIFNQENFDEEN